MSTKLTQEGKYATQYRFQYARIAAYALRALALQPDPLEIINDEEKMELFAEDVGDQVYKKVWLSKKRKGHGPSLS